MTKKTEIPELETFRALDARLADLNEKQTTIDAELKTAQDDYKAAREARAAISDNIGSKELRDARKREQAALERIAELEADAEDADTGIKKLRREVIAAERQARLAIMNYWRGRRDELLARFTEACKELQPLAHELYWAESGAVAGPPLLLNAFLGNIVGPAIGLNVEVILGNRPTDIPVNRPESDQINDVHRSLLRNELLRQATENTLPPAA